ncbi:thermonuclease family protein [Breoghania corrubedonensis]|uniref:thermonuclease family protein n=1 Tax=Breoghania corrubedonensis TaxID=665038 RepID=UPI00147610C0|nr:thermonuclease family protein [Breoghania corrubedonensis]
MPAILAIWFATLPATAEPLAEACRAADTRSASVTAVNEDGSLAVVYGGDARETGDVRLADVATAAGGPGPQLLKALRTRIGRSVVVHPLTLAPDRWQRLVAHVEAVGDPGGGPVDWLQAALVQNGIVRVEPEGSPAGCAAALYRSEAAARGAKRGLWSLSVNRVLSSRERDLADRAGSYRIVAGIVVSVGATSRRHYLNFGRDWSRDFTVTIPAGRASAFRAAGRDPQTMAGRYVRVRGWLERWNGAVIDVLYPDAIEVIGRGG